MPHGKVKWYDALKGFGFILGSDGEEVFLHASALPADMVDIRPGTKVEYSVIDGKRGRQAMNVSIAESPTSVVKSQRMPAEEMVRVVEDLIRILDEASNKLRRGRYPENGKQVAKMLKVVAQSFEA